MKDYRVILHLESGDIITTKIEAPNPVAAITQAQLKYDLQDYEIESIAIDSWYNCDR